MNKSDNILYLDSPNHWIYVFAGLSSKNKQCLKRYFSTIYPRSYVKKLVAAVLQNVQSKSAQNTG